MILLASCFGVLSLLCFVLSFQIKSNRGLFLIQTAANAFYGIQFYLLDARGGIVNVCVAMVRNLLLCRLEDWPWLKWKIWPPLFCMPGLIYMIVAWTGWQDALPFIAVAAGTFSFWTNNAKILRIAQLILVCPSWLIYDIVNSAWGGVLNESVILASIIVSIFRFGWKGLEDPAFRE